MKPSTVQQFFDRERSTSEIIFPGLMELSEMILLYAPKGVGKSFVAQYMLTQLALGLPFLRWTPTRAFKCVYAELEMPPMLVARRTRSLLAAHFENGRPPEDFNLQLLTREEMGGRIWNLSHAEDQLLYARAFQDAEVIVVDNLINAMQRTFPGESEEELYTKAKPLLYALRDSGKTVIIIHHAGKNGSQLGTSIKENDVDTIIRLQRSRLARTPGTSSIEMFCDEKTRRLDSAPQPIHIQYGTTGGAVQFTWTDLEEVRRRHVPKLYERYRNREVVADLLGISVSQVRRILLDAEREGGADREISNWWNDI